MSRRGGTRRGPAACLSLGLGLAVLMIPGAADCKPGYKIEPAAAYEVLPQGQVKPRTLDFFVTSSETGAQQIQVKAEHWRPKNTGESVRDWLQIQPEDFSLGAGARQRVRLEMRKPPAAAGEVLVMLFVGTHKDSGALHLNLREGVPCYFFCGGPRIIGLQIREPARGPEEGQLAWSARNTGTVHLMPFGNVLLKRGGRTRASVPVKFDQPLFAGETRPWTVRVSTGDLAQAEEAEVVLFFRDPYLPAGKGFNSVRENFKL